MSRHLTALVFRTTVKNNTLRLPCKERTKWLTRYRSSQDETTCTLGDNFHLTLTCLGFQSIAARIDDDSG